jgi:transcription-repair coupling factor (superfamily II helicase)
VQGDGGVRRIVERLRRGELRIDVSGLRGSAPVLAVEALRVALGRTVVVYCADEETARDVFADFRTVSHARTVFLPERDILPRPLELRENMVVRGSRNACLDAILHGRADVVVTSLLGFLEKTLPAPAFRRHTIELAVGSAIEPQVLRERLARIGYEGASIVEEPGQYAVRGAILDVYDPSREQPVRFEFSDDVIVSMRAFDIESQKSYEALSAIRVLPSARVMPSDLAADAVETNLRARGVAERTIESIRRELDDRQASPLLRRYAPFLGNDGGLLDFFDETPLVVAWEEDAHARRLEALEDEVRRAGEAEGEGGCPLGLLDYIRSPDHASARGAPTVHLWGLAPEGSPDGAPGDTVTFQTSEHPPVLGKLDTLSQTIRKLRGKRIDVVIYSESPAQRERLAEMLGEEEAEVHLPVGWITRGFVWESAGLAVLTDHEIFHRLLPRPRQKRPGRRTEARSPDRLQAGDFVVHIDYGIGRYLGLEKVVADGRQTECLLVKYQGPDRIYVPLEQMALVEKYIGKEGVVPAIDRLGSVKWQRTKEKTRRVLEDVARDLLAVYAAREVAEKPPFGPDTSWQKELEASFPFEETPHQLRTTEEIKRDMESPKPMDRLVCGDVGFGKTEVAVRAAFKAASQGKQVAVLVPTTILAYQHYRTFRERLGAFPLNVEMLSRFRTPKEQRRVITALREGRVDIVIGTHRLLSNDVRFADIGLLIVDEEHRFGVRSKEKIKRIKRSIDVLSMTATPIPRTLYMSLSGLRRVSIIDTPPRNRHPIKTEVLHFDEDAIAQAILSEIRRGGQVFLVHNRVASIHAMQAFLERLLPDARFRVAHGQMAERDLERVILDFLNREFDVLISTTIIESGLDFPNVNTIIINRADRFGLAELYQLRGRVGRREQQAYAYLFVPRDFAITETAGKRLQAMEEFEELGSGYRLAMRDLEIRGAGNVLGVEQHGQVVAVGFDLYCKMLKEAVERLKGEPQDERPQCRVETRLASFLSDDYVEDQNERMTIYKRLARMESPDEADDIEKELEDRFGPLPPAGRNLIELARMKLRAAALGIGLVQLRSDRVVAEFLPARSLEPALCARLVETFEGRVLFKSSEPFGVTIALGPRSEPLGEARKLLQEAHSYGNKYTSPERGDPS